MGVFLVYIIKSSVCLALFYLFYRLLLSKETFHRFNRMALIVILLLSCVIPVIEVTIKAPMEVNQQLLTLEELLLMAELNTHSPMVGAAAPAPTVTWREIVLMIYCAGILFFFLRNLWSLGRMLRLIYSSRRMNQKDGITLIVHQRDIAPFSWMKFVAISEKDLHENGEEILMHECAHIHKRHSVDLLIADICIFFQWFNPASWLLKQELQNIHEYEADECVINGGIDAKQYQLLLIKKAVGTRLYSMANSFNHSSLKKRITMMLKEKSNPWACLKYLYILPLAAVAVTAFARPEISKELDELSAVKVNDLAVIVEAESVKSVESQPVKEVKLTGTVLEEGSQTPLTGVAVIIRGTSRGTITNADGNFVLMTPADAEISFTMIGCKTKIVKLTEQDAKKGIKVYLEKSDEKPGIKNSTDEVVVVGYGNSNPAAKNVGEEEAYQLVDDMAQYPGGLEECLRYLARNIKYPVVSMEAGRQGKVIVQFIIEKDGSITSPIILNGVDPYLDMEALRVVVKMPRWKAGMLKGQPVRTTFTLPVVFRLMGDEKKDDSIHLKIVKSADDAPLDLGKTIGLSELKEKPLVIVDGVENTEFPQIDASMIESITVLKDASAIEKYGAKGKNGVILIVTKQKE